MRWRPAELVTPTRFLALINVAGSALAFVRGVVVARALGPELLGVSAVIAGVNTTVLNFLDVRLTDLAARLYYQTDGLEASALRAFRASVVALCVLGNGLISLLLGALGVLAAWLTVGWFTAAPVQGWWLLAQALVLGAGNLANTLTFLQRFSGRFYFVGTARLAIQFCALAVFLAAFLPAPDLGGYYRGGLASAALALVGTGALSLYLWVVHDRLPMLSRGLGRAWLHYQRGARFLFFGNVLGYGKLFHRAADTLLVGLLADDRVTGLYKLARQLTDALYVLFDALNQVYQVRFLELLSQKDPRSYRRLATRLLGGSAFLTAGLVVGEAVLLRPALDLVFAGKFAQGEWPILLLTLPFVFVAGVHLWLWPFLIHTGQLGRFTAVNLLAVAAQYAVTIGGFAWLGPNAAVAAAGYLAHYVVLYPIVARLEHRRFSGYMPGLTLAHETRPADH